MLLLQGRLDEARCIIIKVYPLATPHQVEEKMRVMSVAAKQSVMISRSTGWWDRAASLVKVGTNRRALSQS